MRYHRLRNSALAWHLINVPARIRFLAAGSRLSDVEARAVQALREQGIAIVELPLLSGPHVFHELRRLAEIKWRATAGGVEFSRRHAAAGGQMSKNLYLVDLWGGPHVLDPTHPFLRFSLSAPVLHIVNGYLAMLSKFREFFLQATIPTPSGLLPYASQRWHADPDDRRMVKVFLYLNDVDASAGPFTYIRYSHSGGKWRHLFPYAPKVKSRHPDPLFIERNIPADDVVVARGRAGTVIFCDTSGVHRGGYATTHTRLMYTSVYTTPASARATRFSYPPDFRPEVLKSGAARYAVRKDL